MNAAICAVGSELLEIDRLDTNSLEITRLLQRYGVQLVLKVCVGDGEEEIEQALRACVERADLVVTTGGLGPTADDCTRGAVAKLVSRELVLDEDLLAGIEGKYRRMARPMPQVNRRQAERIEGASALLNDWGTAPGQRVDWTPSAGRNVTIFLYPGVPRELFRMLPESLEPWLVARCGAPTGEVRVEARVACVPESAVEERLTELYEHYGTERITVLAKPADLRVRVHLPSAARTDPELGRRAKEHLERALLDTLYSLSVSERGAEGEAGEGADLEAVVVRQMTERGLTLAVAESCTGGLLGQRITAVAGSSSVFEGGAVTYSNRLKEQILGVSHESLAACGAVSESVAVQMAEGARSRFSVDLALAVTGIAGPGGGSEEKPVGTVFIALATPDGNWCQRHRFPGERERVRWQASQVALDMARRWLGGLPPRPSWWPTVGADT